MYNSIDDIDLTEIRFLADSKNVEIVFEYGTDPEKQISWIAQYGMGDDDAFALKIIGRGETIQYALRDLYWKIINI